MSVLSSTLHGVAEGINETPRNNDNVSAAHESAVGAGLNRNSSSGTACLCSGQHLGAAPRRGAGATQSLNHMSVWPYVGLVAGTPTHGLSGPMVAGLKDKCA